MKEKISGNCSLYKLKILRDAMRNDKKEITINGETITYTVRAIAFDYINGKCTFSVLFFDLEPMVITFTKKNSNSDQFISIEVSDNFEIPNYIENNADYNLLREMLELDPSNSQNPFSTTRFFNDFAKKIPNYSDVSEIDPLKHVKKYEKHVEIEDIDKRIFYGWHPNPIGKKPRIPNLNKTRVHFGSEQAERCKKARVSSRWTRE